MQTKIRGIRRGGSNEEIDIYASLNHDLDVSAFLPRYAKLCAAGKVFAFDMSGGTAKPPILAAPTTSPEWGIYNANSSAHIVLLHVGVTCTAGTTGLGLCILITAAKGDQTAVTANYTSAIVSCLDGTSKTPNAYITNNPTLVGGTPAWVVFEAKDQTAVASIGTGLVARVDGMVMAAPKGMVCFELIGNTGTSALFDITIVVAEIDLDT